MDENSCPNCGMPQYDKYPNLMEELTMQSKFIEDLVRGTERRLTVLEHVMYGHKVKCDAKGDLDCTCSHCVTKMARRYMPMKSAQDISEHFTNAFARNELQAVALKKRSRELLIEFDENSYPKKTKAKIEPTPKTD